MWAVSNQTRYKAERAFARDRDGAEIWVVAIRATFSIGKDGTVRPAERQNDVCLAPVHRGKPGHTSLRYEMDLVRTKPGTDVVLHASAHAPQGQPATIVDVAFGMGNIAKSLRVVGDRVWKNGLFGVSPSQPIPFVKMPICYERALGGLLSAEENASRDPQNPVGVGRISLEGYPVPNCENSGEPIRSPDVRFCPAGFGPIPCDWQPRVKLAGTYDEAWQEKRQPLVPGDFQDAYFRSAPVEQQIDGFLSGGEEIVLRNLTPDGFLSFRLPRLSFGFRTRIDGGTVHHRGNLHTVIIEPDESQLIMVWQTSLPCHHTLYTLKETVVFEKERLEREFDLEQEAELVA